MISRLVAPPLLLAILPAILVAAATASAQQPLRSAPVAVPVPRSVPDAQDIPYPGTVTLDVDATDVRRGLYRVTQTIPVAPGTRSLTLLLPEWLPGQHGPRGTMAELVDLRFTAADRPLAWQRDPVDTFAFHIEVPQGARSVTARFIHTSPLQPSEGRVTMSDQLLNLQWKLMSLYPAGYYVRQVRVRPTATFPAGWSVFAALDGAQEAAVPAGKRVSWTETDYEALVDSPIFAGRNAARFDLGSGVALDVVADEPRLLALSPEGLGAYRALVAETLALFGGRHFDRYEALVALTDRIGDIGLEHQRSSENVMNPTALADWGGMGWDRNVLAHEFSHSWIGKYMRPAGLWTPDFRQPMQTDLLWVYEGLNQYYGYVLAARSGIQPREVVLGMLASTAANLAEQPGRGWRSVADTTADPIFAARKPKPYASIARNEDYYGEGALTWLEADQLIRTGTRGRKSLDDFARAFFGQRDGDLGQKTFTFEDLTTALGAVYSYDWAGFFRTRIYQPSRPAPLAGLEQAGYRLVWREEPNAFDRGRIADARNLPLSFSLGLTLDKDGKVTACQWGSPAFDAGIVTGAKILGVNSIAWSPDAVRQAITAAKAGKGPIQLLVQRSDRFETIAIDFRGGLRYPWLERKSASQPVGLDLILAPSVPR